MSKQHLILDRISETYKGKTFLYANNIHFILDITYREDQDRFVIKTNLKTYDRPSEEVQDFMKQFSPASNLAMITSAGADQQLTVVTESDSLANELERILKENIKLVQQDKGYIPQATAVTNNVNSIIHIQKMKLDLMKQLNKKK